MAHHTGTHIIFASCRAILGPHIWQNGAKKTTEMAHLDITHYQSLSKEEEMAIENQANRIIVDCNPIQKSLMDKAEAERQFGFRLYQGGVVPGNELRVVNIEGVDTEACCGTHCDSTGEVGWIKLVKTQRISDGIVRLYYVAHEKAITKMNDEQGILNDLCEMWSIDKGSLVQTGQRFFGEYKKNNALIDKQDKQILSLQIKYVLNTPKEQEFFFTHTDADAPTMYFSFLPMYAHSLKESGKGVIFIGGNYVIGLLGTKDNKALVTKIEEACKGMSKKPVKMILKDKVAFDAKIKGKKKVETKEISMFNVTGSDFKFETLAEIMKEFKVAELD